MVCGVSLRRAAAGAAFRSVERPPARRLAAIELARAQSAEAAAGGASQALDERCGDDAAALSALSGLAELPR